MIRFTFPAGATPRDILSALDSWAQQADEGDVQDMWHILTALRGPDDDNSVVKEQTTEILRREVAPTLASRSGAFVNQWATPLSDVRDYLLAHPVDHPVDISWHFRDHMMLAVAAVERQWR